MRHPSPEPTATFQRRKGALLIVDDDEHMRRLLASLARAAGYTKVMLERDQRGALDAIEHVELCAAVIDMRLERSDGLEVIAAIRRHRRGSTRETPIVALSGAPTEARVTEALRAGADSFMSKPLSAAKFEQHLRQAMRRAPSPAPPVRRPIIEI